MRFIPAFLVFVGVSMLALLLWGIGVRGGAGDVDLSAEPGPLTGRRLTGLVGQGTRCREELAEAGVAFTALPSVPGENCGPRDPVRLAASAFTLALRPAAVAPSCPVAAGLALWEWHAVQPAARRHLGTRVAAIEHFGSYSCRRIRGREGASAGWSEHATANAFDVAAFRLADGRRVSVLGDWDGDDADARFLREVRDGACHLFATVLSPDYNAAHRDHFHFDQAARGSTGWRACR